VFTQIFSLLEYLPVTLELTLAALVIGWVVGLLIAVIKINKIPGLQQLCSFFVTVIRGTPILVQLYITYFGIPLAIKYFNFYQGTAYNINNIPPILFAIVALGLNQSAFDSEIIRAAFLSVDRSQLEAAKSLGMSGTQALRRVILPQVITVAWPSLGRRLATP
jgi:polar amino acid transport system permease protein